MREKKNVREGKRGRKTRRLGGGGYRGSTPEGKTKEYSFFL